MRAISYVYASYAFSPCGQTAHCPFVCLRCRVVTIYTVFGYSPPTPTFLHYRNSVRTICYSFQTISIILLYSLYNLLHFLAHDPLKNFPIPYASACNPVSFSSVNFARMLLLWFSDDFHLKDSFFFVENLSSKVFERF